MKSLNFFLFHSSMEEGLHVHCLKSQHVSSEVKGIVVKCDIFQLGNILKVNLPRPN